MADMAGPYPWQMYTLPKRYEPTTFDQRHLIELRETPDGKGLGLFALQPIPRGTAIVKEAPLLEANSMYEAADRITDLAPDKHERYLQLYGWLPDSRFDSPSELDVYTRKVMSVYSYNCFGSSVVDIGSRFNHSCIPNLSQDTDASLPATMHFFARGDIAAGEELFVSYIEAFLKYNERQNRIQKSWAFTCICPACEATEAGHQKEAVFIAITDLHHELEPLAKMFDTPTTTEYLRNRLVKLEKICELMESIDLMDQELREYYREAVMVCAVLGNLPMALHWAKKARNFGRDFLGGQINLYDFGVVDELGAAVARGQPFRFEDLQWPGRNGGQGR